MAVTSQGIVYPDPGDQPQRQAFEDLAESVDLAIAPQVETAASLGISVPSGWTLTYFSAVRWGALRIIGLRATYSGATITGTADGDISPANVFSNLPVDWRPPGDTVGSYYASNGFGASRVTASGVGQIAKLHATATISSGDAIVWSATYVAL